LVAVELQTGEHIRQMLDGPDPDPGVRYESLISRQGLKQRAFPHFEFLSTILFSVVYDDSPARNQALPSN
jgi:hypothetical protein